MSEPSIGMMRFDASLSLAGIGCNGDSGGPVVIEIGGKRYSVGVLDQVRGTGTETSTGFEFFGHRSDFFDWVEETIAAYRSDISAPTGSVVINNDAVYTNSRVVALTLTATDAKSASGIAEMRLSHNGTNWFSWEPFATSTAWELLEGDGTKTVFAQFRDAAGNVSTISTDAIVLDTTAPGVESLVVSTHMNTSCAIALMVSGADSVQVSGPTNGTLAGTGLSYDYTPAPFWVGSDLIEVLAVDSAGNTATGTVTINVTNTAPVASDQIVSTKMGSAVTVTPEASDPDGDTITSYVVAPPAHGSLSGWTYTPAEGYSGHDSFTVQASDGAATSNIATVNIEVAYVATTGALVVTLQPSSAVSAGAWSVDGGPWHASGETVSDLAAGVHVVAFKSIAASGRTTWVTPSSQTVVIVAGQTVQATGTYTATTTQPTDWFTQFLNWLSELFRMLFGLKS